MRPEKRDTSTTYQYCSTKNVDVSIIAISLRFTVTLVNTFIPTFMQYIMLSPHYCDLGFRIFKCQLLRGDRGLAPCTCAKVKKI